MKVSIKETNISFLIKSCTAKIPNLNTIGRINVRDERKTLARQVKDWQQKTTTSQDNTKICIQPDRIIFSEPISDKNKIKNAKISQIASSYLKDFPEINYQKVSIDFNSYLNFTSANKLESFLAKNILTANITRQMLTEKSMNLALNLSFPYDNGIFSFILEKSDFDEVEDRFYIIWFTGKFDYSLKRNYQTKTIQQKINNYSLYANKFVNFLADNFSIE